MFNTGSNLLTKSGLTADQVNALINVGDFAGLGQAVIDVENKYGLNAFWTIAQMTQEVGWSGHSWIADNKHNLFGVDAYDAAPAADAATFATFADSVENQGVFLNAAYLHPGGAYYVSATPAGIARHYASDPNYASEIVSIMNTYYSRSQALGHAPAPPTGNPAPTQPAQGVYVVQKGDNMSVIASNHGMSLATLEALNPHAGHPAGNYGNIWPGDHLVVSGAVVSNPAPAPSEQFVTVQKGQNLSVIAEQHGIGLGEIEALNPHAGHPVGNFDDVWPGDSVRVK